MIEARRRPAVGDRHGLTEQVGEAGVPTPMRSTSQVRADASRVPCVSRLLQLHPAGPNGSLMLHRRDSDPIHCSPGSREHQRRVIARFSQERRARDRRASTRHGIPSTPATGIRPKPAGLPFTKWPRYPVSRSVIRQTGRCSGYRVRPSSSCLPRGSCPRAQPQIVGLGRSAHTGELSHA